MKKLLNLGLWFVIVSISMTIGKKQDNFSVTMEGCQEEKNVVECGNATYSEVQYFFKYSRDSYEQLIIEESQISEIDSNLFSQRAREQLQKITIINNKQLTKIKATTFKNFNVLETLIVKNDKISSIAAKTFDGLKRLKTLQFTDDRISTIDKNAFKSSTNLSISTLNLTNNFIKTLNANVFKPLTKLKVLELTGNKLSKLETNVFHPLTSLTKLSLKDNLFKKINQNVFLYTQLTRLDISKNKLTTIDVPHLAYILPKLHDIYIDENSFNCNDLQQILNDLTAHNIVYHSNNVNYTEPISIFNYLKPRPSQIDGIFCYNTTKIY